MGLLSSVLVAGLIYFHYPVKILMTFLLLPLYVYGIENIVIVVMTLLYLLAIFGPAIPVAAKHGWQSMASILIAEFLWLSIILIIYFVLFQPEIVVDDPYDVTILFVP